MRSIRLRGRSRTEASAGARKGSLLKVAQSSASCIHPSRSAVLAAVSALCTHSCARCWHSLTLFTGTLPVTTSTERRHRRRKFHEYLAALETKFEPEANPQLTPTSAGRQQGYAFTDMRLRVTTNADNGPMLRARAGRTMRCPVDICGQVRPIF